MVCNIFGEQCQMTCAFIVHDLRKLPVERVRRRPPQQCPALTRDVSSKANVRSCENCSIVVFFKYFHSSQIFCTKQCPFMQFTIFNVIVFFLSSNFICTISQFQSKFLKIKQFNRIRKNGKTELNKMFAEILFR